MDLKKIELGKRNEKYRVWVYFIDKQGSEPILLNSKTVQRRMKNGISNSAGWYDTPVSSVYKNEITSMGLIIENESRWLNAISLLCARADLDKLIKLDFIDRIEPVLGFRTKPLTKHIEFSAYSRDDIDYGYAQEQTEQINVHELHSQGITGEGTRILVMDTGFDLSHNALIDINVVAQWDVINDDY